MKALPWARHHLPSIGILLLGLSISLLMAWTDAQGQQQHNRQLMQRHALVYSNAIQRALEHGQAVVEDLRALFNASNTISRREFEIFSLSQLKFQTSIQALEWLPKVPAEQRARYEQQARQHYPDFQFTDLDHQGRLQPAPKRPVYFPVFYLTPYRGNEQALGYTASQSTTAQHRHGAGPRHCLDGQQHPHSADPGATAPICPAADSPGFYQPHAAG